MILDAFPALRDLTASAKAQLAAELLDAAADSKEVELNPHLLEALAARLAWFEKNPEATFTTEQVAARLVHLKQRIAERRADA